MNPCRLALMPRPRSGDWLSDEIAGWSRAGIATVVSLLESHEIRELDLMSEKDFCERQGIEFLSFPIRDRETPNSAHETADLVEQITTRLLGGSGVGIHCRAGIGRSGLIAGCVLFKLGVPASEIFPVLTQARGVSVPDTCAQEEWLARFIREYDQSGRRN